MRAQKNSQSVKPPPSLFLNNFRGKRADIVSDLQNESNAPSNDVAICKQASARTETSVSACLQLLSECVSCECFKCVSYRAYIRECLCVCHLSTIVKLKLHGGEEREATVRQYVSECSQVPSLVLPVRKPTPALSLSFLQPLDQPA